MLHAPDYAPCMSSVLANNIRQLRQQLGLNQSDFAERVGGKQPNVSKWEAGVFTPSGDSLAAMADLAGCTFEAFKTRPLPAVATTSTQAGVTTQIASDAESVEIIALDLSLSMGPGTLIEEFAEAEPVIMGLSLIQSITRTPSDRLRLVKGVGDSMEPTLRTGDRVMIDINERSLSRINGLYWIDYHGAHGIKRLRMAGAGRVLVISDNPTVENFEVDAHELRIEGRVIWFAREV